MSKKNSPKQHSARHLDKKIQRQIERNTQDINAWLGAATIEEFAEDDEPEYDENGEIIHLIDLNAPEAQQIFAGAMASYAHLKDDERLAAVCANTLDLAERP